MLKKQKTKFIKMNLRNQNNNSDSEDDSQDCQTDSSKKNTERDSGDFGDSSMPKKYCDLLSRDNYIRLSWDSLREL